MGSRQKGMHFSAARDTTMQRLACSKLKPQLFTSPSAARTLSTYATSIRPTKQEIHNKQLAPENLEIAVRSLYHDGLVVVEDAIPHDALDRLNAQMVKDARALQSKKENSPFNYNPGNIQQDAPPVRAHFDTNIFLSTCTVGSLEDTSDRPLILFRPYSHPDYLYSIRALAKVDVLLGQFSHATDTGASSHVTTGTFRRGLCPSNASVRLCDQYPPHHHDTRERLHRAVVGDSYRLGDACPGWTTRRTR